MRFHARCTITALALLPAQAWAQNAHVDGASVQGEAGEGLQDIVVTAQRRSERMQDVPVAITAATGARLDAIAIRSTQDLGIVTPGLSVPQTNGFAQPRVRGIGTTSNGPGIENPVATYVDGVYFASAPGSLLTLSNIERIEVLKGPQGTLFGRNATGGLIHVITGDPSHTVGGKFDLTYGNYQDVIASAYVTGGIAPDVSAGIALHYEHQGEGFGQNIFDGRPVGRVDHDFAGRIKVLFEPTETTTVRLSLDYASSDGDRNIQHLDPQSPALFDLPPFGGPFPRGGAYDVNNDSRFRNRLHSGGGSLQIEQQVGSVTAKSITAYRKSKFQFDLDLDYLPASLVTANSTSRFRQFSQELQLSSGAGGHLNWVAGLYYFNAEDGWLPLTLSFGIPASPVSGQTFANRVDTRQKAESIAGYAQATYELLPHTRVTLGGRFTYENKHESGSQTLYVGDAPLPSTPVPATGRGISPGIDFKRFNYRVALDHKFTPDIMGYLSFNTGFKSGGYVLASPTVKPYAPESIRAAEIGLKTQLFDRRVRFNISGFHYDYSNIQVQRFSAGTIVIYNGAKARLYGVDLDGEIAVARGLTVNGGLSYVHDRFTSFPNADYIVPVGNCVPAPGGVCSGPADGNKLPFTPTVTVNVGVDYKFDTKAGAIGLNASYFSSSRFYAASDNVLFQPAYDLLNASISWTSPDGHLTARVWGKNLGGTVYATSLIEGFSGNVRSLGSPRTYGITAGFNF